MIEKVRDGVEPRFLPDRTFDGIPRMGGDTELLDLPEESISLIWAQHRPLLLPDLENDCGRGPAALTRTLRAPDTSGLTKLQIAS